MSTARTFTYRDITVDRGRQSVRCTYDVAGTLFVEELHIPGADLSRPGVDAAVLWYFLLAGISYYKTHAPMTIDLGPFQVSEDDLEFLRSFYLEGLAEFAYRNELDLQGLEFTASIATTTPLPIDASPGDVLIPFGGGIDSIVTVCELAPKTTRCALFVAERPGERFEAIEAPAALTGLTIQRAERLLDEKVLHSEERGYLNGHVPVTGILSAAAVVTALSTGFGAVAMSNESSASVPTLQGPTGPVNHQWSKGIAFERGFRAALSRRIEHFEYFSWLRNRSELSIAEAFAAHPEFHGSFRSCNRAFHQDPARRASTWCGTCDKCLFVDLVLAPFMSRDDLNTIFGGKEPLENPALDEQLRVLVGTSRQPRPFECVGDLYECQEALRATTRRSDRHDNEVLQQIAHEITTPESAPQHDDGHFIPERYATQSRLV